MKRLSLTLLLLFTILSLQAQKPALNHSVYDSWNTLKSVSIPKNGDILLYTITPGEGDVTLVIENIRTGKKIEIPRANRPVLSEDGSKLVTTIKPLFSQTRDARIKKAKREDMPKDTLAIVDIATGNIEKITDFKSYKTPDKLHSYIAYELNPKKPEKPATPAKINMNNIPKIAKM